MLKIIFFYLFSGSLVLFYGLGLDQELTLKKNVLSWLKNILKTLLLTVSTTSLTYFFNKFVLLSLGVEEILPFIMALFFAGITFGLKLIFKSNYFSLSEEFIIPFLIILVSLSEGFSFLSTILVCVCCVLSFYLFMILVFSIRKRFSLYQKDSGLKPFYILLLSLAAVFVAIYGFNSSWLMLGLKS